MKTYSFIVLLLLTFMAQAQSQKELYNQAVTSYQAKDFPAYLKTMQHLDSLRPLHPVFTYNLASAQALNGNTKAALATLEKLVLMNSATVFETDDDFKAMQGSEGFDALIALKTKQNVVVNSSKKVLLLSEKALHPESVTYLKKTRTWLASSIRKRKIVAFNATTGECKDWLAQSDMLAVFAMKPDAKNEFLWVATAAIPEMEGYNPSQQGKAEILKIAIETKTIVARYTTEGEHVFGDIYITKKNKVYISDSAKPIVYTIDNNQLVAWKSLENEAFNLQGITMNEDENILFVADYLKGVAAIALSDKAVNWLAFPGGTSPKGMDGLAFYKNKLVAIQNGVAPIRITELILNKTNTAIIDFKIKDNNRPEFDEPALGTIVGKKLYFFANSPWKAYDKNGVLDESKVVNPILYSLQLK